LLIVVKLCRRIEISCTAFYAKRKRVARRAINESLALEFVREVRHFHKRMGLKKVYHKVKLKLKNAGVKMGRDKLYEACGRAGLLVEVKRAEYPCTTQFRPYLPTFKNRIKGLKITRRNQVWASDLTYLKTKEGPLFVSFITDHYSRKIVGYEVADSLETIGCLKALEKAIESLKAGERPLHHSDRGCQYASHAYTKRLSEAKMEVSMTEVDHCAENALAERINGILKQEYGLGMEMVTKEQARNVVKEAVELYNTDRPHLSLGMKTPEMVHTAVE
jgi:putative transposase